MILICKGCWKILKYTVCTKNTKYSNTTMIQKALCLPRRDRLPLISA